MNENVRRILRRGKSEPSSSKRLAKHTEIILRVQIDIGGWSIGRRGGSSLSKYYLNEGEREREREREESFRFPIEKERQVSPEEKGERRNS